jgi:hypothetical protein
VRAMCGTKRLLRSGFVLVGPSKEAAGGRVVRRVSMLIGGLELQLIDEGVCGSSFGAVAVSGVRIHCSSPFPEATFVMFRAERE